MIFWFCVVIILLLSFILFRQGPNTNLHNKGYYEIDDDIATIISKIDWANNYPGRINIDLMFRFLCMSIIITYIISLIIYEKMLKPIIFIQCVIIIWILLRAFYFYFRHHCDKFSNYTIDICVKALQKKLRLKTVKLKNKNLDKNQQVNCLNFIYKNYNYY